MYFETDKYFLITRFLKLYNSSVLYDLDSRHPLHRYVATAKRLKSRQSAIYSTKGDFLIKKQERQNMWK